MSVVLTSGYLLYVGRVAASGRSNSELCQLRLRFRDLRVRFSEFQSQRLRQVRVEPHSLLTEKHTPKLHLEFIFFHFNIFFKTFCKCVQTVHIKNTW